MKQAKLIKENAQNLLVETSSVPQRDQMGAARLPGKKAVRKRTAPRKAKAARLLGKQMKLKSDKLVCRYCGSDDLAPSFIKRQDRRCRKCFSKRYGSAARFRFRLCPQWV